MSPVPVGCATSAGHNAIYIYLSLAKKEVQVPVFRIRIPNSIRSVDPDPDSKSGSGPTTAKMTHKNRKKTCFEVRDVLIRELKASPVAWTSFVEAQ